MALSLLANKNQKALKGDLTADELKNMISPYDMKRLELYSNNMADYHLITDLLPTLARLFFIFRNIDGLHLSALQQAILVGIGLQCKGP